MTGTAISTEHRWLASEAGGSHWNVGALGTFNAVSTSDNTRTPAVGPCRAAPHVARQCGQIFSSRSLAAGRVAVAPEFRA